MRKEGATKRKWKYDEMERVTVSASFRRLPYYLTAAGIGKKEEKDGTGKKTDGRTGTEKLGTGG